MADRDAVLAAFDEGVDALGKIAAGFMGSDWEKQSGCSDWRAVDLAGHVLCVMRWWHEWLDRAQAGQSDPPFAWADLPQRNAEALAALPPSTGPERIAAAAEAARAYAVRLPDAWDLPYGCPPGAISPARITAGVHASVAPAELTLHAWDLAFSVGASYRPESAVTILEGLRAVFPIPPLEGDAWDNVLRVSGRTPGP